MPGVYGDMLAAFPELLITHSIFKMRTLSDGAFGPREPFLQVNGYITRDLGGEGGFPDETFTENQQAKFFCFDALPGSSIRQGMYVEDGGELFKFVQTNNFAREGGFSVYKLVLVAGPSDRNVRNSQVEDNIINAY